MKRNDEHRREFGRRDERVKKHMGNEEKKIQCNKRETEKIKVTIGDVDRRGEKTREIIRKREGMEHRKQ